MADEKKTGATDPEKTEDIDSLKAELERMKIQNEKLMAAQSNASSDAAKYKKQLQERMSEQERAAEETKELIAQLKADNERMKRESEVSARTAVYVGWGFDEANAKKAAEAYGSDHEAFSDAFKSFLDAHDKALIADKMRGTPRPGNGAVEPTITKEQFDKMTYTERVKIFENQPELYKKLNE